MGQRPVTVYIDAPLLGAEELATVTAFADLGLQATVVGEAGHLPVGVDRVAHLPDPLPAGAWHLTAELPAGGPPGPWTRTVLIGPRVSGRRTMTGLRHARDVRSALLELLAEAAVD